MTVYAMDHGPRGIGVLGRETLGPGPKPPKKWRVLRPKSPRSRATADGAVPTPSVLGKQDILPVRPATPAILPPLCDNSENARPNLSCPMGSPSLDKPFAANKSCARGHPRCFIHPMGGAQVQSLTPTPPEHFGPLKRGGGGGWDQKTPLSPYTNRYLVPGLSFEGGIFNEQQTTFVPICPHGEERSMWPQNQKWLHKSCLLGGPGKMPRKNCAF